jgi:PhzF family phenazine biosynthesis protein
MKIPLYQVDAFTGRLFGGNPAAVCPLDSWLDDETLQAIAAENNLSATAYFVPVADGFQLRWFTPQVEVDLCGHATLASAFVLMNHLEPDRKEVRFRIKSGDLRVTRTDDLFTLDFPARPAAPCDVPEELIEALGIKPQEVWAAKAYMAVYESEDEILELRPNMEQLSRLDKYGVIVTSPGQTADFVSRFFAPGVGIPEDPVTGSAHCTLIPYWSDCIGKQTLLAHQVSKRGGELLCQDLGDRVKMAGRAVLFAEGTIHL